MKPHKLIGPSPSLYDSYRAHSDSDEEALSMISNSVQNPDQGDLDTRQGIFDSSPEVSDFKVIELPRFEPLDAGSSEFFAAMQEWNGVVTAVEDDHFTADLVDRTAGADEIGETAEIPLDELSPRDRERLEEGVIFRWLVGYSKSRSGQISKRHMIYLRPTLSMRTRQAAPEDDGFDWLREQGGEPPALNA